MCRYAARYRPLAVVATAVVAMPDEKWGETPCAFVELNAGQEVDEASIRTWCREHLIHYKVPGKIVFETIPRTSTGKIQQFVLRERASSATY